MTSAQSGMNGTLWVCATVDGTYQKLGEILDLSLKINGQEIDTSNVDDAGWGSAIMGAKNWEIPASNNLILDDAGYAIVIAALFTTDPLVYIKILTSGTPTATPVGWSGQARILGADMAIAGPKTQQKVNWTIKGSGALSAIT